MEDIEDDQSYGDVLTSLQHPIASKRRDPRSVRLAAVISALLDVVGDEVTASKVYAKAVTALEGTLTSHQDSAGVADSLATQSAVLELLHVTVPHVTPTAILSATLPLSSRVLRAVVSTAAASTAIQDTKDELGGVNALLRWTCRVATVLLLKLPPQTDEKAVKHFFSGTLLVLFNDRRPKVRKAAHTGVLEVLMMEQQGHPAVVMAMNAYIHNELVKASGRKQDSLQDLLHLLPFVERSILYLNYAKLGSDVMEFLAALLQHSTASASEFIAVAKVKESTPKILAIGSMLSIALVLLHDDDAQRSSAINELAPRVLASLLQAKPSLVFCAGTAEFEILLKTKTVYGQVILAACNRILDSNQELACKLLPLAVQAVLTLSRPTDEDPEDATVAQTLLVELTQLVRTKIPALVNDSSGLNKCFHDLLQSIALVMNPIYRPTWSVSLKTLVVLLQHVHTTVEVQNCVESLIELRNDVPAGSASQRAVEDAVSTLIQGVGIEECWNWITWQPPLLKSKGIATELAWILSTMKVAATAAQAVPPRLAFFQSDVLGLARSCDKIAATSAVAEQNMYHSRVVDLWSLFPCFCKSPLDIEAAMPALTATLGRALEDKRYPELLTVICHGLTVLVKCLEDNGGFELENASGDVTAVGAASIALLPVMFKFVSDAHAAVSSGGTSKDESMDVREGSAKASGGLMDSFQKLHCVTGAISSLARLAPIDFLSGLFKKLMHRLLEEVQSESGDSEKICSLLTLSQALVSSEVLDESSITFLYRALKPLIRNDENGPRVQKRAYKVLTEICERHHSFVAEPDRLQELSVLLAGTIMTSQISARYMRLKCLNIIVEGFGESNTEHVREIYKVIAEVLLCLKDSNGKTREAAYQLLLSLSTHGDIVEFTKVIIAALGAETSHMQSAVVMALSRIVFELGWENEQFHLLLPGLLRTVLVLIDEGSREVIKSVVGFTRICVAAIPPERLEPLLPELIGSLLQSQQAKSRFRAKVKIILKKLVKLYGYEALMPHVPVSETRLLTHLRKLGEREKRKKQAQREEGKPEIDEFEAMVDSDEDDSDDGLTLKTDATGFTRPIGGEKAPDARSAASRRTRLTTSGSIASAKPKLAENAKFRLPNETDGVVIDMLGPTMAKRVHFAADDVDDSDSDDAAMEFDDDGKLLVHDHESDGGNREPGGEESFALEGRNKRRRLTKLEQEGTKKKKGEIAGGLGTSYASKKAGGDVKRKGQKYEPYAFVPLDGRAYSKKNRRSAVEQMSSVVRKGGKRKR